MKNAKKTLALALAGTMAVSNIAMASAAEMDTKAKLDKLMDLEVVFGDNTDKDSLSFDKEMERYRSIALMLRLTEEGSGAMDNYDYEGKETFADQGEFSSYVKRVMAYSKNNDIGIDGYEDGTLRPLTTLTDQAYAKMMLESLGYEAGTDYEWSTVAEKAAEVGIVGSADEITNEVLPFGEVVEMTYDTLATEVKGESITLGEKIGKPVVNSKLEVAKVEALNLKQVKVTFTTAVDEKSATDIANYDLDAKNASLTDAKAELVADNAVVITFDEGNEAKQQETVTLTAEDITATNGKVLAETAVEVSFLDQSIPTVEGIEVVGNETLKVTFSEPMKTVAKGDFTVKDGSKKLYLDKVEAVNNEKTEFYVTLYNDLTEGEIDVTVSGSEDYAGFNVIIATETVDVVVDSEAPVIESYKNATPNKVTLVFNEDIVLKSSDVKDFYHTNSKNSVDAMSDVEIEGNEMTLTFADDSKLPEGVAYVYVGDDAIADLWGNENDQLMIKVDVEIDETAPVVEEIKVNSETEIEVKFDEVLKETTAEDKDNYRLVDSEGKEVKQIKSVVYADKVVTVEFKEALSGDHTLFIEDVEDLSGNEVNTDVEFNVNDLTAPVMTDFKATLYNPGAVEQTIKLAFGERMAEEGTYSVADEDKYIIGTTQFADIEGATIEVVDGGKAIEMTIPNAAEEGMDVADTMDIQVARVADAAGNKTAALSGTVDIEAAGTVAIVKAEATAKDTIVLEFDDKLIDVEPTEFVFELGVTPVAISSVDVDETEEGNTIITFNTANDLATDAATLTYTVDNAVSDRSNNQYDEMVEVKTDEAVADKIAPEIVIENDAEKVAVDAAAETVTITFSEALSTANQGLMATDFAVTLNGDDLVGGVDYTTAVSGSDLVITFTGDIKAEDDIQITSNATVNYLTDGTTAAKAFDFSIEVQ